VAGHLNWFVNQAFSPALALTNILHILSSAASDSTPNALLQEKQSISQIFHNVPALERQDTWYPTLRRTVWVLSQLRDFVKPAIFEDIAQETLAVCRVSLVNASDLIKTQQGKALDGALFLVRHLLILKDILVSLESDLRNRTDENGAGGYGDVTRKTPTKRTTLEFGGLSTTVGGPSGVTETITNILTKTTALLPEGLFASLGVTSGIDNDLRGVKMVRFVSCVSYVLFDCSFRISIRAYEKRLKTSLRHALGP